MGATMIFIWMFLTISGTLQTTTGKMPTVLARSFLQKCKDTFCSLSLGPHLELPVMPMGALCKD